MNLHKSHLYRHFKGKTYIILQIGRHTETDEELIVYQETTGTTVPRGTVWIRPRSLFEKSIRDGTPRFTHIGYAYSPLKR